MAEAKEEKKEPPAQRAPLSVDYKDYDLLGILGKGSFACVWFAKNRVTKSDFAVKIIELESSNPLTVEETQKETKLMRSLQHRNIVSCLSTFIVGTELWLVMPLLSGGSCAAIMRRHPEFKKGFKDEPLLATILLDVVKGLEYLHKENHIHRDIKAGNILLSAEGVAKISDFGVSGTLIENGYKKTGRMTFTGTPCWMAPEVMESKGHNHKADIWSLGITAIELAYGKPPYADQRPMKVMLMIIQKDPPSVDQYKEKNDTNFSSSFNKFVKLLLKKDPTKRPKSVELLKNAFLRKSKDPTYVQNRVLYNLPPQKIKPASKNDLPKSLLEPTERTAKTVGLSFDFSERAKSRVGATFQSKRGILNQIKEEEAAQAGTAQQQPAATAATAAPTATQPAAGAAAQPVAAEPVTATAQPAAQPPPAAGPNG